MARRADTVLRTDLNAMVAEIIFGWKDIKKIDGKLVGKKQDKLGRFRSARVPDYVGDMRQAGSIEAQMGRLGKDKQYSRQLAKIAEKKHLPPDWATPELRARAALEVVRLKSGK